MAALKPFYTNKRLTDQETVIEFVGEFDLSHASALQEEISSYLDEKERKLTFDLKELKYIDSTGIGLLITVAKARAEAGGDFGVRNIPSLVRRLFDIAGVSRILKASGGYHDSERKENPS